jgi:copper chaperone CopZ
MSNQNETVLHVQGMSCPSCIRHIKEALTDVEGVEAVDVRLSERKVVVRQAGEGASVAAMVGALADAGYEATPIPA